MPGSLTTQDRAVARDSASARVAFRLWNSVGSPVSFSFAARWLACTLPYRRFARTLADAAHGSGPMRIATPSSRWTFTTYSLPVSRRTPQENVTFGQKSSTPLDRA
jgi:hypothetical protein